MSCPIKITVKIGSSEVDMTVKASDLLAEILQDEEALCQFVLRNICKNNSRKITATRTIEEVK
mgnify:FL=1|jgi:hypothetical protein